MSTAAVLPASSAIGDAIDLPSVNAMLANISAAERLRWANERFGVDIVMLSSMQKTASVLMHMVFHAGLDTEILFVDTGFHFHETLQLRDLFMRKYKLNIVTLYPRQTPDEQERLYGRKLHLFVDGQPECCKFRKEDPFLGYVKANARRVIIGGRRRTEGSGRKLVETIMPDPRVGGYAFQPIFDWTDAAIENYLREHDVPVHPLHAKDYPSIGCACCTTPVAPGEDARAGRWRHLRQEGDQPQYCGINFAEGGGI